MIDNITEKILIANYFDDSVHSVLEDLFSNNVYPIVYAYINGVEKFSFVRKMCTEGMNRFLKSRKGDVRTNEVTSLSELKEGNIFYITCIDAPKNLCLCMINIRRNIIAYIRRIFIQMNSG